MKSTGISALLLTTALLFPASSLADVPTGPPRLSPMATLSQVVGVSEVEITYSRPGVRDRVVWGELVPLGEIWRTGANEATTLRLSHDAMIDGSALAAGTYSLFTVPGETEWTVVFNKVADQWGAFSYDSGKDAARVRAKPQTAEHEESMTFEIEGSSVVLRWEKLAVDFEVAAD